uniref:Integrase catalytic domain-containing protein n=1 Tax=Candidatus Kentrum eta TaxID=2126337 RepID=A0A450VEW7_9GAMM|nr:MAG: hypothetical protein BECKH772B_GA0070898_102514 [Candidatus Kentron sp. H]VFK03353.1 MAG: hypothetical protein BECKH772A_GA0070896_103193 [Candidatus Kentron sp. H]VFK05955.1 MAG: hypothetical protein BECKH772C_GA0070978_103151 [Candidatus Kentron sp. H]
MTSKNQSRCYSSPWLNTSIPSPPLTVKTLNADFYFAHPYASWERGLNENTNGLVRQYFSKGYDFSTIIQEEIQVVMDELTQQPSKKVPWREYT